MTVQNFMKIVWTVFEKFKIFMKMSGEKKHDCITSRKFFSDSQKLFAPRGREKNIASRGPDATVTKLVYSGLHLQCIGRNCNHNLVKSCAGHDITIFSFRAAWNWY